MIFRRRTEELYSKLHLHVSSLHRVAFPWTTATFYDCNIEKFLCPRLRNWNWNILTCNGDDFEQWLEEHGRGSYLISVYRTRKTGSHLFLKDHVKIAFTDKNTALMCKLQLGGK